MGYPLTGIGMDVKMNGTQTSHAAKWTVNPQNAKGSYIDNGTKGLKTASPGPFSLDGTIVVHTETGDLPFFPGIRYTDLKLYVDSTHLWTIGVVIFSAGPIECDPSNGNPIQISMTWEYAGGDITMPNGQKFNNDLLA